MFDLRTEDDVLNDFEKMVEMCKRGKHYESAFSVLCNKFGVEKVEKCNHEGMGFGEMLRCEKCGGTGWVVIMKE